MTYCRAHGTLLNVMWQPGWEGNLGENGYIYMYGQVALLFTWNYHNIVNEYTPLQKKKRVCGTCPWKWPSWKPRVREVEAPTLWKRARRAKGHSPLEQKGSGNDFLCVSIWAVVGHVLMPNSILWQACSHGSYPRWTHLQASRRCWGKQIGGPDHCCFIFGLSDRSHSLKVVRAGDLFESMLSRVTSKVGIFSMCASEDTYFLACSEKSTLLAAFCSHTCENLRAGRALKSHLLHPPTPIWYTSCFYNQVVIFAYAWCFQRQGPQNPFHASSWNVLSNCSCLVGFLAQHTQLLGTTQKLNCSALGQPFRALCVTPHCHPF